MTTSTYTAERARLLDQRATLVGKAGALAAACSGRDFTAAEVAQAVELKRQADGLDAEVRDLDAAEQRRRLTTDDSRAAQARADAQAKAKIQELGRVLGVDGGSGYLDDGGHHGGAGDTGGPERVPAKIKALGGGSWSRPVLRTASDPYTGQFKALMPSGAVPVTVPLSPEPVRAGEPVLSLRQLVPTTADTTGRWSYFRQTRRENNADVVAPGARKPTSLFTLARVEERARTIAHLSEPVHRADMDDAPTLAEFLDVELRLGLEVALEEEIINGDGAGEHFTGLAGASGVQAQPYAADLLTTTRRAITKLEVLNLAASGFVFHPADWERVELSADSGGSFQLAAAGQNVPVDRAARRLWGVPVAVSTAVPVGSGWCVDFAGSTELRTREEARLDWSENLYSPDRFGTGAGGSLFEANMIVFRCELRASFAVKRPAGAVLIDLTP